MKNNFVNKHVKFSYMSVFIRLILLFILYFSGFIYYTTLQTNLSKYFIFVNAILAILIVLKWATTWFKKLSSKSLFRVQLIIGGLYLIIFFVLPSFKCGASTKGSDIYSCDCLGIKKDRIWNFTNRCIGIRTKCYLGQKENIYYETTGKRIVKNIGNEIPCEGSLEFFK